MYSLYSVLFLIANAAALLSTYSTYCSIPSYLKVKGVKILDWFNMLQIQKCGKISGVFALQACILLMTVERD